MKLERFKEKNNKMIGVILFTIICILLIGSVILYKTFASFEVNHNFNIINGTIEDTGNIYFAFYVNDGNEDRIQTEMPQKGSGYVFNSKKSFCGVNGVNDPSIKLWFDRDSWSVITEGLTTARTKCYLYFDKGESLIDKIENLNTVEEGDGLYRVNHENADITYTDDETKQEMLKKEELRYAGKSPDNYVWFNHELWRIIGLVNTTEDQRIKIIRNESIGKYSWDSSENEINNGAGINEWSQADGKSLLNMYYYNSFDNQSCITNSYNMSVPCAFLKNGLKYVHSFIDYIEWNLGSNGENITWGTITTTQAYNFERSNSTGDWCKSRNTNETWYCNDKVSRNITWQGNVALMYPSDYGYATSGESSSNREQCLTSNLFEWSSTCYNHNWLNKNVDSWTLTPAGIDSMAELAFRIDSTGIFTTVSSHLSFYSAFFPTLYLKTDMLVSSNSNGSIDFPYIIG